MKKFRPKPDLIAEEAALTAPDRFSLFAQNIAALALAAHSSSNETAKLLLKHINSAAQCAQRGEKWNPSK